MKILRIQFENLNSLPVGDIDFTAPPFSEAGLFAITGPTGAGKSTILDAITLALYGRAARYQNTPNPVDMMSRRAASCTAEVSFEVDTRRYRARWHLRRARGKADGKLQPPQRHLYSHTGEVLAQGVNEVVRTVEEITGLTYDRFLRSALLAQGQFARFLMANESERAQLLESLTGTEIYAELGQLAYREATDRLEALERRAAVLEGAALLSPEALAGKTAELAHRTSLLPPLRTAHETARTSVMRGQQLAAHLQSEAALSQERAAAERELAAAASEQQRLALHRQGEPFYPRLQTVDTLSQQVSQATAALASTADASREATRQAALAQAALAYLHQREEATLVDKLQSLARAEEKRAERLAALRTTLEAATADASLDHTLPDLLEQLSHLVRTREGITRQQRQEAALTEKVTALEAKRTTQESAIAEATTALRQLAGALSEATAAVAELRKGRTEEELQAKTRRLEQQRESLVALRGLMQRIEHAQQKSVELADQEGRLTREIEEIRIQAGETERERKAQEKMLTLAEQSHARLLQISSLESQRYLLQPGQPCPLCGSCEHPDAHRTLLSAEIEDAQRRVETARSARDTAVKEAECAKLDLASTEARLLALRKQNADLRREQTVDHERFITEARPLRVYTLESLEEKSVEHQQLRTEWDARLLAIRDAEQRRNAAELAHVEGQNRLTRLQSEHAAHLTALADLKAELQTAAADRARAESELLPLSERLAAALRPFYLPLPAPGDETALRETLQQRQLAHRRLLDELTALEHARTIAAADKQTVEKAAAEHRAQAGKLRSDNVHPEADLHPFLTSWDGPQSVQTGRNALETLHTRATALASREQEQQDRLATLRAEWVSESKALNGHLASSPFASVQALREARLTATEQQRILTLLETLTARVQTVTGKLEQVRSQISQLREAAAPEGEQLHAATVTAKEAEQALIVATEQRAALERELRDHEERARQHQEALAALAADRERLDGWVRLKALIGGPAFRKFAQGLTLDLLLRHANQHLARLSDRYRLQRAASGELELEIIDLHQAEARRPAASLSGGESFLASLALALGLSDLAGQNIRIDSLFIDEGFGTLDPETLDIALSALDTLRLSHKTVGVISHVELLKERIPVQITVEKLAGGESRLRIRG